MTLHKIDPMEELSADGKFWTGLHYACLYDNIEILEHFIKTVYKSNKSKFVDITNLQTKEGWTPLMISCIYGKVQTLGTLLGFGGQKLFVKDREGFRASDLTKKFNQKDAYKILKKQLEAYPKDTSDIVITPINISALEESEITKDLENLKIDSVEDDPKYERLFKIGKRVPCVSCRGNKGWLKYTKCCGVPMHHICRKDLNKCPSCNSEELTLITDVLFPEKVFYVENN
jgi:hypothetical protein